MGSKRSFSLKANLKCVSYIHLVWWMGVMTQLEMCRYVSHLEPVCHEGGVREGAHSQL